MLNKDAIKKIIPHREPFLMIDEVVEYVAGVSAVAIKRIREDEEVFKGHFPEYPVYPGVLIVEAMAQTGAVALLIDERFRGKVALFAGIDKLRFKKQVHPPAELRLEIKIDRIRGVIGKGEARAFVEDELVAEGELIFAIQ